MFASSKISIHCRHFSNFNASTLLSKENKETCIKKFQEMLVKQGTKQTAKQASVLIPIYTKNNEVSLLYTRRAATLRTHRGQISFPGGMVDKEDPSWEYTAMRETKEELGIKPEDIEIWGKGNPIVRQDLQILPVIGLIKKDLDLKNLRLNYSEVDDIFTVEIEKLVNPMLHRHTQFRGSYTTPTYLGGPSRIWGLTAVITFMFLKALLPRTNYPYQVKYIPDVCKILAQENASSVKM